MLSQVMYRFLSLVLALGASGVATPQGQNRLTPIRAAFDAGRFEEAALRGRAVGSATAKALAAQAILAGELCGRGPADASRLKMAERLGREALEMAPGDWEARLQLALALSLQARALSPRAAYRSGHGQEARKLVEQILEDDPGNGYAHGFLAVWHIEVIDRGGGLGAMLMGASLDDAMAHYERAAVRLSQDPALHWQVARALAAQDTARHGDEIRHALSRARAGRLSNVLEREGPEAAQALARNLL